MTMRELTDTILNEVLSLNAQEFRSLMERAKADRFLNEVLSLNAQELTRIWAEVKLSLHPQ